MIYFLQGLTLGLAYVAPIGLQNLFVINTAISQTKKRTYATIGIIVFFDITLALACFFGIGAIIEASKLIELAVLLVGGIIVIWIGVGLLKPVHQVNNDKDVNLSLKKVIITACVVTWFNPQALIDGTMMLGAFRASLPDNQDISFITGVISASALWFFSIGTVVSLFKKNITARVLRYINIICGAVIVLYGIKLLFNFFNRIVF